MGSFSVFSVLAKVASGHAPANDQELITINDVLPERILSSDDDYFAGLMDEELGFAWRGAPLLGALCNPSGSAAACDKARALEFAPVLPRVAEVPVRYATLHFGDDTTRPVAVICFTAKATYMVRLPED